MASILEVCEAGCDYIDVGMEPLSWGTGHADLLSVQAMLKDAGYQVPEINMEAYMKVRGMIQEFMDDFLGLYISPKNRLMNSLLIAPGLPGNPPARTVRNRSCKFPDRHLRSGPQPGSTFYPLTTGTPEKFRLHPTGHGVPFRHRPRPLSVTTPPRRGKPSLRISDRTA